MVVKVPFSLFDFKHIREFGPQFFKETAGAGVAIGATIYTVKPGEFVLLLSASVYHTKTTGTQLILRIVRKPPGGYNLQEVLINDTAAATAGSMSWPSSKSSGLYDVLGWHLCFLFPGDSIYLAHALTAAEAIEDVVTLNMIVYADPRWED